MNFLAVDTSGKTLTVIAKKDGKVFHEFLDDCAMRQSVLLMGEIEKVLQKSELRLLECDFFACVVGAGSFTGIRIGISAMKGFCLAEGKPALPVTAFECMAYNEEVRDKKILALVDALHGKYYAQAFDGGKEVSPPLFLTEEEVEKRIQEGFLPCAFEKSSIADVRVLNPVEGLKNAVEAKAGLGAFGELNALYIQKSQAERNA